MNEYIMFGMKLKSDFVFRQLVPFQEDGNVYPEVTIQEGGLPEYLQDIPSGIWDFGVTRSWLSNKMTVIYVENGDTIRYVMKEGAKIDFINAYLLGWGMSMLAMQKGMIAMHCSAIADEEGAILISGNSGAGKSTLTNAFLERGYRLMADDMAFIETKEGANQTLAYPAFPYQKLCRNVVEEKKLDYDKLIYIDEDKDKFLVPYEGEFKLNAVPIKGFIMLDVGECDSVVCKEVKGLDAFHTLINNLFLRTLLREKKYNPENGAPCLKMASNVPVAYLKRPKEGNTADEVVREAFAMVEKWKNK